MCARRRGGNLTGVCRFFFCFRRPIGLPVKNAVLSVDPTATNGRLVEYRAANRALPVCRCRAQRAETCTRCCAVLRSVYLAELHLTHAPSRPQKMCRFLAREPSLPALTAFRQHNRRERTAKTRFPVMSDSCAQVFKFAAGNRPVRSDAFT